MEEIERIYLNKISYKTPCWCIGRQWVTACMDVGKNIIYSKECVYNKKDIFVRIFRRQTKEINNNVYILVLVECVYEGIIHFPSTAVWMYILQFCWETWLIYEYNLLIFFILFLPIWRIFILLCFSLYLLRESFFVDGNFSVCRSCFVVC